ncbi:MAG: SUMF1/EgtB/PvdO family nonheme iron enzyme [Treponema sp.]|nr:SUMF1/EgtB/PvdO family nonheme iron enzyme [Treponema sp.]
MRKYFLLAVVLILAVILTTCKNPFWNIDNNSIEMDLQDTIIFTSNVPVITKTYGDPKFTNAIANTYLGTGSIVYSSSDKDVAVVDENTGEVTIKGVGETAITAVKAADARYVRAEANYILNVNKAKLNINVVDIAININDPIPEYMYSVNGLVYSDTKETAITGEPVLSCDYAEDNGRGSYPITIEKGTLNAVNYELEFISGALSVGLKVQETLSITESSIIKTWGDGNFTLNTIGGSGEGKLRYRIVSGDDVIRINGNTVTILKAGTAEIKAQKRGDDEFIHTESYSIPITINKRNLSNVSVSAGGTFSYTGHVHTPVVTVTDNDFITASDYNVTYNNNRNAGKAEIILSASEYSNYTGTHNGNFTINKAMLTIIADDIEISFGADVPEYTYTINGFVSGEGLSDIFGEPILLCNYSKDGPVGKYYITPVKGSLTADNYDFTFVDGELSVGLIHQADLIINNVETKTYGDSDFYLSVTGGSGTGNISYWLIDGADVIDINETTGKVLIKRAGTAQVYARKSGDSEYSSIYSAPIIITVNKRSISNVTVSAIGTFTYTGLEHQPQLSVTDGGLINASDWNLFYLRDNINAGTATITITASDNGNYIGMQYGEFTINKAVLTVTTDNKNISFGSAAPAFTYTITGYRNGENVSVVLGAPELSSNYIPGNNTGNYIITIVPGNLAAFNYSFSLFNGTLSVGLANQAAFSINAPGARTYGDAAFTLSTTGGSGTGIVDYTVESGGNVISITGTTVTILNAGTATVRATKQGDLNFNPITSDIINITVDRANPVINWPTNLIAHSGMRLMDITLPGNGTSNPSGVFTWGHTGDYVGSVGTRSHLMFFWPEDQLNYNPIYNTVNISVGYLVTFNTSPHNHLNDIQSQIVMAGNLAARPSNPFGGGSSDFDYWYTNPGLTIPFNFTAPVNSDYTLYAKWIHVGTKTLMRDRDMVWIPGGTFRMGSPSNEPGRNANENYRTANDGNVTLSGFWMSRHQVTQEQWTSIMGNNPSRYRPGSGYPLTTGETQILRRPVDNISWAEAVIFCNRLSVAEDLTPAYSMNGFTNTNNWNPPPRPGNTSDVWSNLAIIEGSTGYRLPTEAQWEYACRFGGGHVYTWHFGFNESHLVNYAWYNLSGSSTRQVGLKLANQWGLFDMYGNVWEWCWDKYAASYNNAGGNVNPRGASISNDRVLRGGSFQNTLSSVRSAARFSEEFMRSSGPYGLRLVRP